MEEKPWYHHGLQFECLQCGRCCTGEEGYVWVTDEEINALADATGLSSSQFEAAFVRRVREDKKSLREFSNGDCVLWNPETRGCRFYSLRPVQCQTWPFWRQNTDSLASWKASGKFCPGCNLAKGKLYSEAEITERVNQKFFD